MRPTGDTKKHSASGRNGGDYKSQRVTVGLLIALCALVVFVAGVGFKVWGALSAQCARNISFHEQKAEPHPSLSKRLDSIEKKIDRQWRVIRNFEVYGRVGPPRRTP